MKTIQVGFSIPKDHKFPIFSWLIRFFESENFWSLAPISHAYVRWFYGHPLVNEWNTYEASGSSVHFLGNVEFTYRIQPVIIYEVEVSDDGFKKALKYCISNAGKDYGIKGAIALAVPSLKRKFTKKVETSSYTDGTEAQFCSEVVGRLLQAAGVETVSNFESLGPRQLSEVMENLAETSKAVRRVL